ncbi:MAG: hypothetical protein WBJ81_02700, partial [Rickettsiales bacterium]
DNDDDENGDNNDHHKKSTDTNDYASKKIKIEPSESTKDYSQAESKTQGENDELTNDGLIYNAAASLLIGTALSVIGGYVMYNVEVPTSLLSGVDLPNFAFSAIDTL